MINIAVPLTIIILVTIVAHLWGALHTCHLPGCQAGTSESGPGRLCPRHRARQTSDLERAWARSIRRSA